MKLAFCWLQVVGVTVVADGFDDEEEPEDEEVEEVPDEVDEVPGKVEGESVEDELDVDVDVEDVVDAAVVVHGLGIAGKSVIPCCRTTASISGSTAPS
jgi:uncharacterized phage protein gp47/JayE